MKRLSIVIITVMLLFSSCSASTENKANTVSPFEVKEIQSEDIELLIKKGDFWKFFYSGMYFMPDGNTSVTLNDTEYNGIEINYNNIQTVLLDVCGVDFGELESDKYSPEQKYADMPFASLQQIKQQIEQVYTLDYAQKYLYDVYDSDYTEQNGKIYRAFFRDTVFPFSTNYETVEIIYQDNSIIEAAVECTHHIGDEIALQYYTLENIDGKWLISDIKT